jgi:crossover junction endodeoxyribonuclease RusA
MNFEIVVPIRPKSKSRPRAGRNGFYTDRKTKDYENLIGQAYKDAGGPKFENPVNVKLKFKKNSVTIYIEEIESESKLRGDIDNYAKAVLDGLNDIAYLDDKQVLKLDLTKE